ncbi:MAG: hypothetical protein AAFZ65_02125 [Planctomycetota bacterium]
MKLASRLERPRRGAAILPALMVVTTILGLCMAYLQVSGSITKRLRASADTKQAFPLAEAGLAEAYAGLTMTKSGNVGSRLQPATYGGGYLWVEATDQADGTVVLESQALYGFGHARVELVVRPEEVSLSSLGFFANSTLAVPDLTAVDSFNSSVDTYAWHVAEGRNREAVVGSNGDVDLTGTATVLGSVVHGPTSSANVGGSATVTGDVAPRRASQSLPDVSLPNIAADPPQNVAAGATLIVPAGDFAFDSIHVLDGGELVLKAPLNLTVDSLTVDPNAKLTIDNTGGAVSVYARDGVTLATGSALETCKQDSTSVTLQIAEGPNAGSTLAASGQLYGQIYAPRTEVAVGRATEVFGSLVADRITLEDGVQLHFDLNTIAVREDALPELLSWRVIDTPQELTLSSGDPIQVLGVDPSTLAPMADAHADQVLELTYVDAFGATRTYSGSEAAFDWRTVEEVVSGKRDGESLNNWTEAVESESKPALSADDEHIQKLIESSPSSNAMRVQMEKRYPLSTETVVMAVEDFTRWRVDDLHTVVLAYGPTGASVTGGKSDASMDSTILAALLAKPDYPSDRMADVLVQNSPLRTGVVDLALARVPALDAVDLTRVLAAQ